MKRIRLWSRAVHRGPRAAHRRALVAALLVPLLFAAACARAETETPGSVRRASPTALRDTTRDRVVRYVYQGPTAYVRIEAREPGAAPNEQPLAIDEAWMRARLRDVLQPVDRNRPLFLPAEIDEIARPLARALSEATPDQDVCFGVSAGHGMLGSFGTRSITTGRVFAASGKVNLVFGLVQRDVDFVPTLDGKLAPVESGHRAAPVPEEAEVASAGAARRLRGDWLAFDAPPVVAAPRPLPAATEPAPAAAVAPGSAAPQPPSSVNAPAASTTAPVPPPLAPAAKPGRSIEDRLRTLQRLRDLGLVTPEEYESKRRQILSEL